MSSSNYTTIVVDTISNQLRYISPIHQFQNWGPNQNPNNSFSTMTSQINSCNVMTITNNMIGIGTTSPQTTVHIVGAASNALIIDGGVAGYVAGLKIAGNSGLNTAGLDIIHATRANVASTSAMANDAVIRNTSGRLLMQYGSNATAIVVDVNNNVGISNVLTVLGTSSLSNVKIAGYVGISGNVGIGPGAAGLTAPVASTLTIAGNASIGAAYANSSAPPNGLIVSGNVGIGVSVTGNALNVAGPAVFGDYAANNTVTSQGVLISGNVGIGTNVALTKLSVAGNATFGSYAVSGTTFGAATKPYMIIGGVLGVGIPNPQNTLDINGGLAVGSAYAGNYGAPTDGLIVSGNVGIGTISGANSLNISGNVNVGYTSPDSVASAKGMIIKGSVGIGTYSAVNTLDINGSAAVGAGYAGQYTGPTNGMIIKGSVGIGTYSTMNALDVYGAGVAIGSYAGQFLAPSGPTGTGSGGMIMSGNLGVGLTNPAYPLHVMGNAYINGTLYTSNMVILGAIEIINSFVSQSSNLLINNISGVGTGLVVQQKTVGGAGIVADFYDTGISPTVPALRISNGGFVGINTTAPASNLDVFGNARVTGTLTANLFNGTINASNISGSSSLSQWTGAAGTSIYYSSNVGINTSSAPASTYALYVSGDMYATGDIVALSDNRYKTDLEVIRDPIEKIKQVSGYTFLRTDIHTRQTGVLAQELERVLPEAVHTDETGGKSVAYGNVVGLLIEAIKAQQVEIDALKRALACSGL